MAGKGERRKGEKCREKGRMWRIASSNKGRIRGPDKLSVIDEVPRDVHPVNIYLSRSPSKNNRAPIKFVITIRIQATLSAERLDLCPVQLTPGNFAGKPYISGRLRSSCSCGHQGRNRANRSRPRSITRHNYRPENGFL